jgi:hypothetical protein
MIGAGNCGKIEGTLRRISGGNALILVQTSRALPMESLFGKMECNNLIRNAKEIKIQGALCYYKSTGENR